MKRSATANDRAGAQPGKCRVLSILLAGLLVGAAARSHALGSADGGFESGFTGMTTSGDARVVSRLGILVAPQGTKAALLTTTPDVGSDPDDATSATLVFPGVAIPAGMTQLRFQAAFLTNELTPSLTDDGLSVILRNQTTLEETVVPALDTFGPYYPAPWTGYSEMTGWRGIVVDVSALAGSAALFEVEFRLVDEGDGRADSAALIDNVRLVAAGLPVANAGFDYAAQALGAELAVDGRGSTDDATLVEHRWDFGDGSSATGPTQTHAYSRNGVFQGALTVTDNDGNQDTDLFTVAVGPANNPPVFTSTPRTTTAESVFYSYTPTVEDPELPFGDALTFALTQGPADMTINPASGRLAWLTTPASPRSNPVTLTVTDSLGLSATHSFTLTVAVPTPFIAASDEAGNLYVIESNGDGTWSNHRLVATLGVLDWGIAVADYTGDGYADILGAVSSVYAAAFYLLVNDGTNHFVNRGTVGSAATVGAPYGMAAGDLNHDGHLDVVASGGTSAGIAVGLGRGDGTFTFTSFNTGSPYYGREMDIGDVNQDGHLDFVRAVSGFGEISYYRGNGDGSFTNMGVVADPGSDPYGVTLADFNNDGFLDLVANEGGTGNAFFYAGNGTGAFAAGVAVTGPDVNHYACFDNLDANGDGTQDIVMADYTGLSLYYVRGNGDGTFQAAVKINPSNTLANVLGISATPGPAPAGYPVAVLSPTPFFGDLGATVDFDASASSVGGGATSWTAAWQFGDGGTATGVTRVSHTYPAAEGDYAPRLTVTDNLGRVAIAAGLVRLYGDPPVAAAGGPYIFGESFANGGVWTVPLNGSGSSDSSGKPLTYAWDLGNALSETFGTPYQGNLPAPGLWAYSSQVTLAGGEATIVGANSWSNRYLVTKTQYPRLIGQSFRGRLRVTAGSTPYIVWGLKNASDTYDYSQFHYAIYFNNNTISIYEDGANRGNVGAFTNGVTYELRLDVRGAGADYYLRQVGAPAWTLLYSSMFSLASPFRFGATVYSGTCTLSDFDCSSGAATAASPTGIVYPRAGTYGASLTVTDTVGQTDTDTAQISLVPGAPPVARPGGPYTPGEATANCGHWPVIFSGAGSSDDSSIYAYLWDFGDGTTGTGIAPSHTYAAGGTYPVTLTVWDQALQSHTAATTVTTSPGALPVARPGGPYTEAHTALAALWTIYFDGSASSDDVGICSYSWDFGDGTALGSGPKPTHSYNAAGTYTVTLTVRDQALQEHHASTTVDAVVIVIVRGPDLTVPRVDASAVVSDCQTRLATGRVVATLRNEGDRAVEDDFAVRFFEDRNRNHAYDTDTDLLLGTATSAGGLAVGAEITRAVDISAALLFRDSPIWAEADAGNVVVEDSDDNNIESSAAACTYLPPPGSFHPVLEWAWTASAVLPGFLNVMNTPMVADMNADGIPDVVFASTDSISGTSPQSGVVRIISGDDGHEIMTVTDPALRVNSLSSLALADLDLDGAPEIVAVDATSQHLIALEHDGTRKWTSVVLEDLSFGAAAIADLDGDGHPEIVFGRQVLDSAGHLLWTGTGGRGQQTGYAPLSVVADLDLDGHPEVIAGNTAYRSNGSIYWQNTAVADGFAGIGEFNDDGFPEIVLVANGNVYLLGYDGTRIWGPKALPGGGRGGAPTVADYDGDGQPEVGVAGMFFYAVFETDGTLKWQMPIRDTSSNVTGSSVFDFDGDGSAEVIYRSEVMLYVYRGSDGAILFQAEASSCTLVEYPIVADVDADGKAELISMCDNNCDFGTLRGIFVYGDANDSWVAARRVWNQHSYHVTNVNDDLSIPAVELPHWRQPNLNNFRRQAPPDPAAALVSPDLTSSYLRVDVVPQPFQITLTARVGNGGSNVARAPLNATFYDGDPAAGGRLLGNAATTANLLPGAYADVALTVTESLSGSHTFFAVVGHSALNECRTDNNVCWIVADLSLNEAPIINPLGIITLTPITEDTVAPAGDLIADALAPVVPDPITDANGDPDGLAVVGLDSSGSGRWQFMLPGSASWTDFGAASDTSATLLSAATALRFVPDLSYNHGQTATLTFRAWDHTAGTEGDTGADASANGGHTAFSAGQSVITLMVTDVNHPPTATPQTLTTPEDTALAITLSGTDPDGDTLSFAVVDPPVRGTLAGVAPHLIYTPALNYSGTDSLRFRANDGTVDSDAAAINLTVLSTGCRPHQADQNGDWIVQLSPELTRLIQFYNRGGYHCQPGTEDGYAPGPPGINPTDTACGPHQADQNGDWTIQLSPELTRLIQFYNSSGYHCEAGTEDGYAPEAARRSR